MPNTESRVQDGLLTVEQVEQGERIIISLQGELDLANALTAEAKLDEALLLGKEVVVDLGELEFLDSTGISLIVTALARPEGSRLSFVPSRNPGVRRLFALTGLDSRVPTATTDESAPVLPAA